ncbi:MAG TPA: peptidylprolyl isomerase [Methylomirabilota bacterium]|nr:peptidylprolyl isomerase [Methylomirabilota bacterium]
MSPRGVAAIALLVFPLMVSGCSIPTWVPLLGKSKPAAPAEVAVAQPSASAPILTSRDQLHASEDVVDRVICVVNNDAITQYELDEAELYYLAETRERPSDGEARKVLRTQLLQNLIENRIQLQQAEREKVVIEDAELAESLSDIMRKLKAKDEAEFEGLIKTQGLTLEGVKKRLREQLMVQRVVRRKVALRISVTEQEIDRYLTENREKLETGLTFAARHILVMPDPTKGEEGWTAARLRADEIYGHLLEGQDFIELAKKYSDDPSGKDGGSLGNLKRGELAQDIEEAILRLSPGEASTPFRSKIGYHLFRLDSREALTGDALVQARGQIREILYRQKYDTRLKDWLVEIKQRAIIDIRM